MCLRVTKLTSEDEGHMVRQPEVDAARPGVVRGGSSCRKARFVRSDSAVAGVAVCVVASVVVVALPGSVVAARADGGTIVTFDYTGAAQTWTVPSGVTSIQVTLAGAQGDGPYGGLGGRVQATIDVTPGTTLNIYVGGHGSGSSGGFNGGGGGNLNNNPGAGGGASDIRIGGTALSDRVLVAGGGGGQGKQPSPAHGAGGSGGGPSGEETRSTALASVCRRVPRETR